MKHRVVTKRAVNPARYLQVASGAGKFPTWDAVTYIWRVSGAHKQDINNSTPAVPPTVGECEEKVMTKLARGYTWELLIEAQRLENT